MKIVLQDGHHFVLRFDKGEEVMAGLGNFLKEQGITACTFSGIGAVSEAEIAYFNPFTKEYRRKPFVEELEIGSLNGNGSVINGQPSVHMHAVFGKNDFTTLAGHVFKLVIGVTGEIFLTKLEGEMKRELNNEMNLNLLA